MNEPTKRRNSAILDDIFEVYCALSPENLSCDGELRGRALQTKAKRLRAKLRALFTELGRTVSEDEVWERQARLDDEQREYEQKCRYGL